MNNLSKSLFDVLPWGKWIIYPLLFAWTVAQPVAVLDLLPLGIRMSLFFWKNIIGVFVILIGLFLLLIGISRGYTPTINKPLLGISLVFPFYSLFTMLFRVPGTSIEEQILYFLWPLALYMVFPPLFATYAYQRKGIWMMLLANLVVLGIGILPYLRREDFASWLDYQYRAAFGFTQPNIYSASWAVIFASSLYLLLGDTNKIQRYFLYGTGIVSIILIFFARSESMLLMSFGILLIYFIFESQLSQQVWIGIGWVVAAILLPFLSHFLNPELLNDISSGRIQVWQRTWELNFKEAVIIDYFTGKSLLLSGNIHYTGERMGFQAARAQSDNAYIARFLQSGLIGFLLYFVPFILMLRFMFMWRQQLIGVNRKYISWIISVWFSVFLSIWALDIIPSFGNVINIFLFIASAVVLALPTSSSRIATV